MARPTPNLSVLLAVLGIVVASCGSSTASPSTETLAPFDPAAFESRIEAATQPMVVNVWASWCIPCRSEAPLLREAHERFSDRVTFVGVAIQDTQADAAAFISEFDIPYENLFDPRAEVWALLGGPGVPITHFILPGGEVVATHFGVIDERTLALQIDELLARHG